MNDEDIIKDLPFWNAAIRIQPLDGGITNHNYKVTTETASDTKQYVVRLGSDIPVHQILRFNEIAASKAAHAAGLSPAIQYHCEGVLVMDYIAGKALTPEQVRRENMLQRVLPLVKRCHQEVPKHLRGASIVFWVFHVIRNYTATLFEANSTYADSLPQLLLMANELEAAAAPFDIVFSHNDLLAANILDDGERLWLIDWEYGGFNTPLFDLGGIASNNELDEAQERWMLESYFEKTLDDDLWRRYQAMKTASLLRETLWSMVSELYSSVDFDYRKYTAANLARFDLSLAHFKEL
ncbi:MAG: phosphotransferase [Granulosicoccus sp.]